MLKLILAVIIVAVVVVLVLALGKPSSFRYSRFILINASAEKIFPFVNDLHQWGTWSPYDKLDPQMKKSLGGASQGVGAFLEWDGNMQAGAGKIEIIKSVPSSLIDLRLRMTKPMNGDSVVEFTFDTPKETPTATTVTWTMSGPTNLLGKLFSVFVDCEKMVTEQFDDGLTKLKAVAEK